MIEIKNKSNCCGCHSCSNICPKDAIEMKEDIKGFKYPVINKEKCINCDLCEKVCPIINKVHTNNKPQAYACINKDEKIRLKSSSGGIFSLISESILDLKGVVFGAQFDDEFNVIHSYTEDKEKLYKFRGSKYVQSTIGDTFKKVKEFLEKDKYVLFTGTPCQIEALYSFLQKEYDKLYTQDIICHGVPSPKVWKKYKEEIENKNNSKTSKMTFRDKRNGWANYSLKWSFSNKNVYVESNHESKYMKAFLKNFSLRDSCYECNFKKKNRMSDITLADFWGIENIMPEMYNDKGTSLVILNTKKGRELFDNIKEKIESKHVDFEKSIEYNPSMIVSSTKPKNREEFFRDIEKMNFDKLQKKYFPNPNIINRILQKIKAIIKKLIKILKNKSI